MPSCTEPACQNLACTSLAWRKSFICSYTFTNMMYQLPMDMITRMISVPLDTKSPCFHRASSPYGFSITSLAGSPAPGGGVGAFGASAGAGVAAAGAGAVWAWAGWAGAWARASVGATNNAAAGAHATSAATSNAGRRLMRFIVDLLGGITRDTR